jgi:phage terminase large subunit-like protein
MVASAQRLAKAGVTIQEFPQSVPNLTAASQQLYELIHGQSLVCYPSEAMRLAVTRCVAVESSRGWRIGKDKQSHKIDVVVALAMACHAAVQDHADPGYDQTYRAFRPDYVDPDRPAAEQPSAANQRLRELYSAIDGAIRFGVMR